MQKRLFIFMILMISLILKSGSSFSVPLNTQITTLSQKSDFTKHFPIQNSTSETIGEEDQEDDEDETIRKTRVQYAEESELEHLPLYFKFFPPKKVLPFLLIPLHNKSTQTPPYSPPDFC